MAAALFAVGTVGCATQTANKSNPDSLRAIGEVTALSKQYVIAPIALNDGMLALSDDLLYINLIQEVLVLNLNLYNPTYLEPGSQFGGDLFPLTAFGGLVGGPGAYVAILPNGEDVGTVVITSGGMIFDVWSTKDGAKVQFDEPGHRWVAASSGTIQHTGLELLKDDRKTWNLGTPYQGSIRLAPGGGGRLALLDLAESQSTRAFDPITRRFLPIKLPKSSPGSNVLVWVDQGRIFAQIGDVIVDYGRYDAVASTRASEDALHLSPWSVLRSADKQHLTVRSIYNNGPRYKLIRKGRLWSQYVSTYGLYALYDDGDVFDLRNGKLAFSFEFDSEDKREFLIRTPSGDVAGTQQMLRDQNLLEKNNPETVLALVRDVLRVRTPAIEKPSQDHRSGNHEPKEREADSESSR